MNDVLHNGLVNLLVEAERAGIRRQERHAMSSRYHDALEEFMRYRSIVPVILADRMDYFKRAEAYAAEKARNYITRHKQ